MIYVLMVLILLLVSSWITLTIICVDEGYRGSEWVGIVIACLFSPLMVFIVRPVVLSIKRIKTRRKKKCG